MSLLHTHFGPDGWLATSIEASERTEMATLCARGLVSLESFDATAPRRQAWRLTDAGREARDSWRARLSANGRLLLQLSFVALADADAIVDPYAWPPRTSLTDEEHREVARLRALSSRLAYRAATLGWTGGTNEAFTPAEAT